MFLIWLVHLFIIISIKAEVKQTWAQQPFRHSTFSVNENCTVGPPVLTATNKKLRGWGFMQPHNVHTDFVKTGKFKFVKRIHMWAAIAQSV
jgi:hypothetical protein